MPSTLKTSSAFPMETKVLIEGRGSNDKMEQEEEGEISKMCFFEKDRQTQYRPAIFSFPTKVVPEHIRIKEDSGVFWGVIVQPLVDIDQDYGTLEQEDTYDGIARCSKCYGYINPYCSYQFKWWKCQLCGNINKFSEAGERYTVPLSPKTHGELFKNFIEFSVPLDCDQSTETNDQEIKKLIHVAIVDETGDEGFMELLSSSILAALEALHDDTWFGLITFSDCIGVYDLLAELPHCSHIAVSDSSETNRSCREPLHLYDAFSLDDLIVHVGPNRERIKQAISSIRSRFPHLSKRALGTTLKSFIQMIRAQDNSSGNNVIAVRCLLFLNGIPNYGEGAIRETRYGKDCESITTPDELLHPAITFYDDLSMEAAENGIRYDIFVVSELAFVDLATLYPLTRETGGNLLLYTTAEEATLPQDIYRILKDIHAFDCLLRIRTSPEFKVIQSSAFGDLKSDHQYENLWRIVGCDSHKAFSFDFEFTSSSGYTGNVESLPIVQLAFAYTSLVRCKTSDKIVPMRKLRVYTVQLELAHSPSDMLLHVDLPSTVLLLTHKVIAATRNEGIDSAKILLRDWLVLIIVAYNTHLSSARQNPETLDFEFEKCPELYSLPRMVFGLLNSDLLQSSSFHPDVRIYTQSLCCGASPTVICKMVYPNLWAFESPDKIATRNLPLSMYTIESSGYPIFLLDAYTRIYLYYHNMDGVIFPPPQGCLIREVVNYLKEASQIAPRSITMTNGSPNVRYLKALLIDDEAYVGGSFSQFMFEINKYAMEEMQLVDWVEMTRYSPVLFHFISNNTTRKKS